MTPLSNLVPGGGWYAVIEQLTGFGPDETPDDVDTLFQLEVLAWERIAVRGRPELRAWLVGCPPVASDRWDLTTRKYEIVAYTPTRPKGLDTFWRELTARTSSWDREADGD